MMIETKELAREIITRAYPEGVGVFDTLWDALIDVPVQSGPLAGDGALSGLALAATGAIADPLTTAVFVVTQASHGLGARASWERFKGAIEHTAKTLDLDGIVVTLVVAGEQIWSNIAAGPTEGSSR